MALHRLLYTSRSVLEGGEALTRAGRKIAEQAVPSNRALGLTGVLLLVRGCFMQSIEGPLDSLELVFERICRDLRHRDLQLLDFAPVSERHFGSWSMGFVAAEGHDLEFLAGDADEARGLPGLDAHEALSRMRRALEAKGPDARRPAA